MEIIKAIILGIVQGLTEFLPVSSSGHLEIAKAILGNEDVGELSMMTTVVLHFATALSTIVIFRKDVSEILRGLFQFKMNDELLFSLKIILSMIPAAFVGFFFEDIIDSFFNHQILLVGFMLLLTGVVLLLADKAKNTGKGVSFKNAFIIGIAQAIAILPGISRSGSTIGTSVLLGIDREKSARFSFLMVVPLGFGVMASELFVGALTADRIAVVLLPVGLHLLFATVLSGCTSTIDSVKSRPLAGGLVACCVVGASARVRTGVE